MNSLNRVSSGDLKWLNLKHFDDHRNELGKNYIEITFLRYDINFVKRLGEED